MTSASVGTTIGSYELGEVIGKGALATVYKAYQPSLKRWVAIKILHVNEKTMLARLKREAKAVAQLRHRNILMVYEYGEEDEQPYIVMELVEGGTLEDHLHGEPMEWFRAVNLTIPIAEALQHAHEHDLIHRDVKPSNILMPQENWPLLADFGLVKVINLEEELTGSDLAIGTPAYMSPEQAQSNPVDSRTDIYSLGVILFQMVTGRLPFEYKNSNLMMYAHISKPVPSPSKFNSNCPPELEGIILTALQKSPEDRYADMQAMIGSLKMLTGASTMEISSPSDNVPPTRPLKSPPESLPYPVIETQDISFDSQEGISSAQSPRILLPDKNVTFNLDDPDPGEEGLIIGRGHGKKKVDIDLSPYEAAQAGLSRQHARLIKRGDTWLIDDLGSLNGTRINGTLVTPGLPVALRNGDIVHCARISFVFLTAL